MGKEDLVRLRATLDDINENNLKIIDSDKKRAVLKEKLEKTKEKQELDVKWLILQMDGLTIEELRYVLEAMGLKKTGTKSVLIARIVENGLSTELKTIFSSYTVPKRENEIKLTVIATGFTAAGNPISDDYDNDLQELLETSDEEIQQEKQMKLSDIDLPPFLRRISRYRNQTSSTK